MNGVEKTSKSRGERYSKTKGKEERGGGGWVAKSSKGARQAKSCEFPNYELRCAGGGSWKKKAEQGRKERGTKRKMQFWGGK